MSNKAFITKFQENVNNDNLPYYGGILIYYPKDDNLYAPDRVFSISANATKEGQKAKILSGGYFTNYEFTENKGKSIDIVKGNTSLFVSNEDTVVLLQNCKYADNIFRLMGTDFSHGSNQSKSHIYFNIDDLKYISGLEVLTIYSSGNLIKTQLSGDISSLKNLTALKNIILQVTSVSGDISSLKNLTALRQLAFDGSPVSGDISSLKNLTALTHIGLGSTLVSGDISSLSNFTALNNLALGGTQVTGTITDIMIANWSSLKRLVLPKSVSITDEQKTTLTNNGCTITIV